MVPVTLPRRGTTFPSIEGVVPHTRRKKEGWSGPDPYPLFAQSEVRQSSCRKRSFTRVATRAVGTESRTQDHVRIDSRDQANTSKSSGDIRSQW